MALTILDRFRGLLRSFKIFANPNTSYVNFIWTIQNKTDENKPGIKTHTFYDPSKCPVEPLLMLMAQVAGKSETLEMVNTRAEFYLKNVCVYHTHYKMLKDYEIKFVAQPIRAVPKEEKNNA